MSHDNNTNVSENAPSQWAQIMCEIVNKLSGTNMSTNITFDGLEMYGNPIRWNICKNIL
jgi:hypothetical protein